MTSDFLAGSLVTLALVGVVYAVAVCVVDGLREFRRFGRE